MNRPRLKPFLLLALSAVSGLAAGFGLRALRHPHPAAPSAANAHARTLSPHPPQLAKNRPSALATTVENDLSLSTGVTRWLVWMTAVEKASLDDFPHLARLAREIPGAVRMLGARWMEISPQTLFDACQHAEAQGPGFPVSELAQLFLTDMAEDRSGRGHCRVERDERSAGVAVHRAERALRHGARARAHCHE